VEHRATFGKEIIGFVRRDTYRTAALRLNPLQRKQPAVESQMPVEKAVNIMWLQPQAVVDWSWNCRPANGATNASPTAAPPIYFWFIPLASRGDRGDLRVSRGRTQCHDHGDGPQWVFEWQLSNRGKKPLPLSINLWSPIGAVPCAAMS
jgi:hypothetical protein